jgi:hypothetical protein
VDPESESVQMWEHSGLWEHMWKMWTLPFNVQCEISHFSDPYHNEFTKNIPRRHLIKHSAGDKAAAICCMLRVRAARAESRMGGAWPAVRDLC